MIQRLTLSQRVFMADDILRRVDHHMASPQQASEILADLGFYEIKYEPPIAAMTAKYDGVKYSLGGEFNG